MRIAIDAHSVGTQLAGNVTYITNMIESLAEIDQTNEYTLYVTRPEAYEMYSGRWPNFKVRKIILHENRLARILFSFNVQLRTNPADIFFVQFTAPPFTPCKIVSSIHDLSFEHLPDTFKWVSRTQMRTTIRWTARHSEHIVTCSEYSRQDIIRTYEIKPEKVTFIPLAAPASFKRVTDTLELERIRRKYELPADFILGVGSVQPRKNLVRLIAAYSSVAQKRDVPPLILVGKKAWLFEETVRAAAEYAVEDKVRFTGFVPDEDLPALYTLSTFFVYPSFFEGFGIPPLEAMQCGSPVIAGDRTSLPEVVGDAGMLVDPFDVASIVDALERLISDAQLREELRIKGFERAKLFSWKRSANETLGIFEKVVND
jgi:glycosyltransferase involved in cell wall biosynthesis